MGVLQSLQNLSFVSLKYWAFISSLFLFMVLGDTKIGFFLNGLVMRDFGVGLTDATYSRHFFVQLFLMFRRKMDFASLYPRPIFTVLVGLVKAMFANLSASSLPGIPY